MEWLDRHRLGEIVVKVFETRSKKSLHGNRTRLAWQIWVTSVKADICSSVGPTCSQPFSYLSMLNAYLQRFRAAEYLRMYFVNSNRSKQNSV